MGGLVDFHLSFCKMVYIRMYVYQIYIVSTGVYFLYMLGGFFVMGALSTG